MGFDINVIPSTGRTPGAMSYHRELYMRSMDTWCVYNPTEKDFVVWNDRKVTGEHWVIPEKNKDIGHGKGMQHVPGFIKTRYVEQIGIELINKKIKEDWDAKKENYRAEERGRMEETLALRSNNPELWKEIIPVLVKGVVVRYGGEELLDLVDTEQPTDHSLTPAQQAMKELNMEDFDMEIAKTKEHLMQEAQ